MMSEIRGLTTRRRHPVWHVYCDESRTTQNRFMVFGGLVLDSRNVAAVVKELDAWRSEQGMIRELKWKKVSRKKLGEYRSFVDFFFQRAATDVIHFKAIVFDMWKIDYKAYHSSNKELGFYKFFYQFLLHRFGPYATGNEDKIALFMHRRVSSYKLDDLRRVLNNGMRQTYGRLTDAVVSISAVDTKTHPEGTIIQVG